MIIENITEINPGDKYGKTPLHLAVEEGCLEIVELIIQNARDKNPEDYFGRTPLHLAADNGHCEISNSIIQIKNIHHPLCQLLV